MTNAGKLVRQFSLAACALLLVGAAWSSGQVPGQLPGQSPGQGGGPSGPPLRIPHIGGPRQQPPPPTPEGAPIYIVLWFDTEDYILPQSDDAAKRIAVFLTQEGIPGTFKVVGEKARVLEQRGREDVVSAVAQHDIGYHSNTHSQHPTVAEYESNLDWDAGVEEFNRREHAGFEEVAHIFRKTPVAYGQPGVSWAPQAFPALEKWGVRVYLDEGKQVGLRGRPFFYGGLLNIFNTPDGEPLRPDENWSNLDAAKARFHETYLVMSSRKSGGLISLCFHPCEFVHKQFWDYVNFREGANPPREQWALPPMKSPEETEKAFQYFEGLVQYMKSFPRVQFLSASQAAERFRDHARNHVFSNQEVGDIASQVAADVTFEEGDSYNLAPSEIFFIINKFLAGVASRKGGEPLLLEHTPYGPASTQSPLAANLVAPWDQVSRTIMDVQDEIEKTNQIPSAIWLGSQSVPPESYLVAIAKVAQGVLRDAETPDSVTFAPARLAASEYVADDSADLWDWIIFPRGFHAPKLMSLAKLQAWTLKPAGK